MLKTVGYHTIGNTGEQLTYRIKVGPVLSRIRKDKNGKEVHPPMAGEGFYFWDNDLDTAHWWGKMRYGDKKKYRIFQMDFTLKYDNSTFFDLVGSMEHLKLLAKFVYEIQQDKSINTDDWKMHNYIRFLRSMNNIKPGTFPFKIIRFNDASTNNTFRQIKLKLNDLKSFTYINPIFIICVLEWKALNLQSFKHVH